MLRCGLVNSAHHYWLAPSAFFPSMYRNPVGRDLASPDLAWTKCPES